MPAGRARTAFFPALDLAKPAKQEWTCQVVVWRAQDVPANDPGGFVDMYLRAFFLDRAREVLKTDTHLRAEGGRGSFNWRFRFPVELPLPAVSPLTRARSGQVCRSLRCDWDARRRVRAKRIKPSAPCT